jgi:carbohydrate kinase (thermoresistant glucokinase family)
VLACSALKRSYREILRGGRPEVRFVYLKGDPALLRARLAGRRGHYMPPSLLDSQIATLEEPQSALVVTIDGRPEEIATRILAALGRA